LNPILDNVLAKNYVVTGRKATVKIGEKEVDVHKNFKLYITTRMSNPHYTPEVSCKVAVVNFCVKLSGLVDQCLGIVVKAEQATLEKTKNETIAKVAANKSTIINL
jgi:dynein heavy chain